MRNSIDAIRDHLLRVLDWEDAHVNFDKAVDGVAPDVRGRRAAGFEHSPWQLLEHIRLAQDDILDFCINENYQHRLAWPDDYWPAEPAPPGEKAWTDSLAAYGRARAQLKQLVRQVDDLTAPVPTGKPKQTYLRAILLTADHTAYHVGQLVAVRRALGSWP
jgi:hypothetical protein